MPYTHFGKQADVWKHLALCEVMVNEKPKIYIETNSASAVYSLNNSAEQQYGIYNFIDKAPSYEKLNQSAYCKLESTKIKSNKYLGSPGLAMSILGNQTDKFIFYDTEKTPLKNISEFAKRKGLFDKIETVNQDSLIGLIDILHGFPKSSLIHIDPYCIDEPNVNGLNYLDLFAQASIQGLMCFLWYGFHTLEEKKQINDFIATLLAKYAIDDCVCVELIMEIIQKDYVQCDPGVMGSGLLISNISNDSISAIIAYNELLVELYKGSMYNEFKGDLYSVIIKNLV